MSGSTPVDEKDRPLSGESFLQRFNRKKLEARGQAEPDVTSASAAAVRRGETTEDDAPALTDADMPPLASLSDESDYTGFLSEKVSESLRRAALRKLFHSPAFNVIDELDDYNEDFTTFESLGDIVTAEMRRRVESEEQRAAERLAGQDATPNDGLPDDGEADAQTAPDDDTGETRPVTAHSGDAGGGDPTKRGETAARQPANYPASPDHVQRPSDDA